MSASSLKPVSVGGGGSGIAANETGLDRASRANRSSGIGIAAETAAAPGHRVDSIVGIRRHGEGGRRTVGDGA